MTRQNIADGVFYHAVGKQKDEDDNMIYQNDMMQTIWEFSVQGIKNSTKNYKTFQLFEYNEGVRQYQPSVPIAGFENSLFYRKVQLSEALASQIPEHQLKNNLKNIPIKRTSFNKYDCQAEMDFHINWRNKSIEFPLTLTDTTTDHTHADFKWNMIKETSHYPKMCAMYLEEVMNAPINLKNLNISAHVLDSFERKLRLRLVA